MYIEAISNKSIYVEMLNDTFYHFTKGEEPLDEEAYKEIESYNNVYPYGFIIDWLSARDLADGKIGATLRPFVLINVDAYWQATKYLKLCIKYKEPDQVDLWWYDEQSGKAQYKGSYKIQGDKKSRYFSTGKNNMYFLSAFTVDD